MPERSQPELIARFQTGDIPTGNDFADLIETMFGLTAGSAIPLPRDELFIPASSFEAVEVDGATPAVIDINDKRLVGFLFDYTAQQAVQFALKMPDTWDGAAFKAKVSWMPYNSFSPGATVTWALRANAASPDGTYAQVNLGSPATAADAVIAMTNRQVSPTVTVTPSGASTAGSWLHLEVARQTGGAPGEVLFLGLSLQFNTINAIPDAW